MQEILIDVTRLVGRVLVKGRLPTGVDRVGLAYVAHYGQRACAVVRLGSRLVVMGPTGSRRVFDQLLNPAPTVKQLIGVQVAKAWWSSPRRLDHAVLFNTGHSGLEVSTYPSMLQRLGVSPVFLVHDLIPISHPEYCRPGEMARHQRRMDTALTISKGLIANSQETLEALQTYADKKGWPLPPAIAAHLAPPTLPASSSNPVGRPYFVMLGTIEPRKNHWMLLQVWRRLIEKHGSDAPQLVIVGQRGWECENVVDLLERGEHLREHVIELSRCSDAELATYLHHAQALLFPSFAEGYGLPLVEALSVGTPVIASDLPVFKEIAGDIPDYVDPLDGLGWLSLVEEYAAAGSSMRNDQRKRIQTFVPTSWQDHFEQVDAFLEGLP
jgi:glycosyltransferase involved in cell wall biosynthesis